MNMPDPIIGYEDLVGNYYGRCFIVGNGPSLNDTPLHLLENEYSFGMNNVSLIFDKTTWRPSFFLNTSRRIKNIWKFVPFIIDTARAGAICFLSVDFAERLRGKNMRFMHVGIVQWRVPNRYDWSDNPHWLFQFGTSVYSAAQIASVLGFKEIILLGCDMGWKPWKDKDPNHFNPEYNAGIRVEVTGSWAKNVGLRMKVAHEAMLERTRERGIMVYDATLGGQLDVYPKVGLMEILNA